MQLLDALRGTRIPTNAAPRLESAKRQLAPMPAIAKIGKR